MSETVWKFSIAIYLKCDELTCLFINSIETEWIGGEDECECNRTASDGLSRIMHAPNDHSVESQSRNICKRQTSKLQKQKWFIMTYVVWRFQFVRFMGGKILVLDFGGGVESHVQAAHEWTRNAVLIDFFLSS